MVFRLGIMTQLLQNSTPQNFFKQYPNNPYLSALESSQKCGQNPLKKTPLKRAESDRNVSPTSKLKI